MKKVSIEIVIKRASIKDAILAEFDKFNQIKSERLSVVNETKNALNESIESIKNALNEDIGYDIWVNGTSYKYNYINKRKYLVATLCFNTYYRNTTTPLFQLSIGYELEEEVSQVNSRDNYYYIKNDEFVIFLRDDSESTTYNKRIKTYQLNDISEVHNLAMNGYKQWIKQHISE